MDKSIKTQILEAEERLRLAMLHSDINALHELLAPELIYTNHLGQVFSKQEDLAIHQSGELAIQELNPSEQRIQIIGEVALVTVRVHSTASYRGTELDGDFRFTRVWSRSSAHTWQIIAAHCSAVA